MFRAYPIPETITPFGPWFSETDYQDGASAGSAPELLAFRDLLSIRAMVSFPAGLGFRVWSLGFRVLGFRGLNTP